MKTSHFKHYKPTWRCFLKCVNSDNANSDFLVLTSGMSATPSKIPDLA